MVGSRRFSYCISIMLFVLISMIVLNKTVSTAAGVIQPMFENPFVQPDSTVPNTLDNIVGSQAAITDTLYSYYFPIVSRSYPILCGDITVDTVLTAVDGPYRVTCDVSILSGVTLTIEAGTKVYFSDINASLDIGGKLIVLGTDQDPVFFQPSEGTAPGSWSQIMFQTGSSGVLDHVVIRYGGNNDSMLSIDTDAVQVSNSIILGSASNGIYINGSPKIEACQILSNTSQYGGGLYIYAGAPTIQNNFFASNSSGVSGGGIYNFSGNPQILNNVFTLNEAIESGGGIYNANANHRSNSTRIFNNIVVSNTASVAGGIFDVDASTRLDYNDVWNNAGGDYNEIAPGAHDISVDPRFADPDNGDFHLTAGSPCIDTGDPAHHSALDFEGDPRPMGMAPEIGPDEYRTFGVVVHSQPEQTVPGATVTYTLQVINRSPVTLTNLLVTDTLPVEAAYHGYQADGFSCVNNATWVGQLECNSGSASLAPGESRMVTVTVALTEALVMNQVVTNTAWAFADTGNGVLLARDQASTGITRWCSVQLNDTPMGSNVQGAIDASTEATDVLKVSGYCGVNLGLGKSLTLQGGWRHDFKDWNAARYPTTLDGRGLGSVIQMGSFEPDLTIIEFFIITGGYKGLNDEGGGIDISIGSPTIQNNIFIGNTGGNGGALSTGWGGTAIVRNNIFINNVADNGAAIYNHHARPIIINNIIVDNTANIGGGGIYNAYGLPMVDYNDVWNNSTNYANVVTGMHDISVDPMFVNPAHGDFHLLPGSACIDTGDRNSYPAEDLDGDARPMGPAPEMGLDEFRSLYVENRVNPLDAAPGDPLTYTVTIRNPTNQTFTNLALTDTLPVDTTFTGYQASGFTCVHNGSAWGGRLRCTVNGALLQPDESRSMTVMVSLAPDFPNPKVVTNPVFAAADMGGQSLFAQAEASTQVGWCAVRLNDTPMGSDLQAGVDASTHSTDVVKVSGYCPVHDLNVNKPLTLQGGWQHDFGVWAPGVYTTTLDGQRLGRVITVTGNITPTIEHFTITGGRTGGFGAGISIPSGNPTIQHNVFVHNSVIYNFAGENNWNGGGGGLYNGSGNPLIQDNIFRDNMVDNMSWSRGGGLLNDSGSPIIQNNTFDGNSLVYMSGGGGLCNISGNPIIQSNLFRGNIAGDGGGGLFNQFGTPLIQNNTFIHNSGGSGAGINSWGSAIIQNNIFIENLGGYGGAMYIQSSTTVQNNIFAGNIATYEGGGIVVETDGTNLIIQNNTFYNNMAAKGGGIAIWSGSPVIRSNIIVKNTASEAGGGVYAEWGTPTMRYNDVWNNSGGNYSGVNPGAHDISSNPRLVDPAHGNFHIASNSPCINKGDPVNFPPTDFEGDHRPHGSAPDIGADEYYSGLADTGFFTSYFPTWVFETRIARIDELRKYY